MPSSRLSRRVAAVVAVLAVLAVVVGVALVVVAPGNERNRSLVGSQAASYDGVQAGLCETLRSARSGDLAGAYGVFLARSHTGLHVLAEEVAEVDRPTAARLLEAKTVVEASLPAGAASAVADLERLLAATQEAVERATDASPRMCEKQIPNG